MQKVTARDTKAEILKAYNELTRQLRQAQSDLTKIKKAKTPAPVMNGVSAIVPANDIASVLSGLEGLRKGFGESSGELQSRLTTEAESLLDLRGEIDHIVSQLKAIHDVEPGDDTLEALIKAWKTQTDAFATEMTEARAAFAAELDAARLDWSRQVAQHKAAVAERNQSLNKSRAREQEEYAYDLRRRRDLDQDAYQQEQNALQAGLDELKRAREAAWAEREKALTEREDEFAALEAKVEAFPEARASEVKLAKEIGAGIARRQARIKSDLLSREHQGLVSVYELKIQSLEKTIAEQDARLSALHGQLTTAQKRAQELAVKAIEGAANESSFMAIKEIALEQAKTPNKK